MARMQDGPEMAGLVVTADPACSGCGNELRIDGWSLLAPNGLEFHGPECARRYAAEHPSDVISEFLQQLDAIYPRVRES